MASKQHYLDEIRRLGIDKLDDYIGVDLDKLHWSKLQNILEKHTGIETPMTQEEAKDSQTPNFAEMLRELQEAHKAQMEQLRLELDAIKRNPPSATPQTVYIKDTDETWGMKRKVGHTAEDFEKTPTTFMVFGRGYVTSTYFKDGVEILSPTGAPIMFKYSSSSKRNINGKEDLLHISTYKTNSKIEKEWIRNHPMYNRGIYEKISSVLTYDPKISNMIESVANNVTSMDAQQIFIKAQSIGINTDEYTLDKLKTMIITSEAQRLLEDDIKIQEKHMNNMIEQKMRVAQTTD